MTGRWTASLSAALGLWVGAAGADEFLARPVTLQPPSAGSQPAAPVSLGRPVAPLGRPVPLSSPGFTPTGIAATSYTPLATGGRPIVRAQAPDAGPPPVPPPGVPAVPAVPGP